MKRERKFSIHSLVGEEGLCEDFSYKIRLSSLERLKDKEIGQLIGNSLSIAIAYTDKKYTQKNRYINGLVYGLDELGMSRSPLLPDVWEYEVEIGSWFRQLEFIKDCRIFQKNGNSSLQLITDLLREYELFDFRSEISGNLPRKDYVVLYNESISDFIKRLLRDDSIVWKFEHYEGKHVLVFSDDTTTFPVIPGHDIAVTDSVQSFFRKDTFVPVSEITEAAFEWENTPVKKVLKSIDSQKGQLKNYLYTGLYQQRVEGESKVDRHGMAIEGKQKRYDGESTIRAMASGCIFKLDAPTVPEHGESFLVKSLRIEATDQRYFNSFTVVPARIPYYPARLSDRARTKIAGPQTAVVVGEGNSGSVQTDRLGRVKVRFHWDHHSPKGSSNTSAYLRVAMPSAGAERGFLFNPRIGEEVVVDFEDGNPDKPYIIGSVYSKNNPPPFAPNSKPFNSIIKNSHHSDANQIIFADKLDSEELEIIAKKNMDIDVNNNMKIDVKKDMSVRSNAQYIIAKEGVDIKAGNSINNQSLVTILSLAALANINTAGGNILNLAAGLVKQAAGGILSNLAGVLMANTSLLGITQSAQGNVKNESSLLMLNTASEVINAGDNTVDNKASLAILNYADTEIVNKGKSKEDKISLMSNSEAGKFVVTGNTNVGP
ncbi:MAG: type VI secretion system tip protein VgrG [Proteobacteria bacterium]|nr:type VI secretion system tip protein VgrG [Pseudomonadota bacterium]